MISENIISDAEALSSYVPKNKAEEHFVKALRLMKTEFFQSATIEFHQACKLDAVLVIPLTKKLYMDSLKNLDYAAALSAGLLLYSVDNSNYKLAIELAGHSRNLGHYKQAANLYKKALEVQPNSLSAMCSLAALSEKVPYHGAEAVNAYKYFANINYIMPDFLTIDDEGELEFDPNYLKNISYEVLNHTKNLETQENDKKDSLLKDFGLNEQIGKEAAGILYEKRSISQSQLKIDDYAAYLEDVVKKSASNQEIALYNLVLMMVTKKFKLDQVPEKLEDLKKRLQNYNKKLPFIEIIEGGYLIQVGQNSRSAQIFLDLLKKQKFDRYANANFGLILRGKNDIFKAARYLIFAYYLFEQAGRSFNIEKIIKTARVKYRKKMFKEAAELFLLIIHEKYAEAKDYGYCADCLDKTSNTPKAIELIKQCMEIFPSSDETSLIVDKFHRNLVEKADNISKDPGQERKAFLIYKTAYSLDQRLDTVKKMLSMMEKFPLIPSEIEFKSSILERFRSKLESHNSEDNEVAKERQEASDARWANYVIKAKDMVKNKNYNNALSLVELAFDIKDNQETFTLLCNLYKILGRKKELTKLIENYQKKAKNSLNSWK